MKIFNTMENVGTTKYVVNYHDGVKTHSDNSPFFDIATFSNKKKRNTFINGLIEQGYTGK